MLPSRVTENLERGDSVLVSSPSMRVDDSGACLDLLTTELPGRVNVLYICSTVSLEARLDTWDERIGTHPAEVAFLDVTAESPGSSVAPAGDTRDRTLDDLTVEQVSPPSDFTTIGVRITDVLDGWNAEDPDSHILVCFESISVLLQYAGREVTFKFLHSLIDYFSTVGAISHYHLDPTAHDEQTVEIITELFDVVCTHDEHDWTVRTPAR